MGRMKDIEREFERQRQEAAEKFLEEMYSEWDPINGSKDPNMWPDTEDIFPTQNDYKVDEEYLAQQRELAELKEKERRLNEYQTKFFQLLDKGSGGDFKEKHKALIKEYNDVLGYDYPEDDEDETREVDIREEKDNQPIENLDESNHSDVRELEEKLNFNENEAVNVKNVNSGNRLSEKTVDPSSRVYKIKLSILNNHTDEFKHVVDRIDTVLGFNSQEQLHEITWGLNLANHFEHSEYTSPSKFEHYRGKVVLDSFTSGFGYIKKEYWITTKGFFPTILFEILEFQFPELVYLFECYTQDFAVKYRNDDMGGDFLLCVPTLVTKNGNPATDTSIRGILNSLYGRDRNIDLEKTPIYIIDEVSSIPAEQPEYKPKLWLPYKKYSDSQLNISENDFQFFFPDLYQQYKKGLLNISEEIEEDENEKRIDITKGKNKENQGAFSLKNLFGKKDDPNTDAFTSFFNKIEEKTESLSAKINESQEKFSAKIEKGVENLESKLSEKTDSLGSRLSDMAGNIVSSVSEGETKKKIKKGLKGWLNKLSDKIDDL